MASPVAVVLVKFRWPDRDPVALLRDLVEGHPVARDLRVFRALEVDDGRAYVDVTADQVPIAPLARLVASLQVALHRVLPGATVTRLAAISSVAGASSGEAAPWHYVVETDVLPEREADFNAWYEQEHLPGLASVPGTVRAMRYRNVDGHPRYHACYDLARPETLGSPPWLAVRGTPWSGRVRPAFVNTRRTMFRRI
ncbi:MAG TPA: hypothetical protein VLU54_13820 [Casimicrobiaceae bacterium]|nr:hypothetical protein [Casimicrobiaceae bacterium]